MQKIKYKTSISLLIVLASILLVLLCLLIVHTFRTGEEATVGIFSLAATLVGTIFIAIELKNGSEVTCSEMLINLNNYFHDSDRLMKVYEVLENAEIDGDYSYERWKDVSSVEVAQYCTFFENLYLLYRHHIASIDDLDDLFGYRFFLFMNNPYIQEKLHPADIVLLRAGLRVVQDLDQVPGEGEQRHERLAAAHSEPPVHVPG